MIDRDDIISRATKRWEEERERRTADEERSSRRWYRGVSLVFLFLLTWIMFRGWLW